MTAPALPLPAAARRSVGASISPIVRSAKNQRPCPFASDAVFAEPPALASAPLGPLCDHRSLVRAPLAEESSTAPLVRTVDNAGQHGWSLRHLSGETFSPRYAEDKLPLVQTGQVLDVYAGLLIELMRAGLPLDGRVRIGRQDFLRRIQWTDEKGHPSGSAYEDFDACLAYLFEMRIRSSAIERFEEIEVGVPVDGALTFRILQAHGRVSAFVRDGIDASDRVGAGHRADDLLVWFSAPFVRLLRNADQRVTYRLSHYLAFKRGSARALYRYVAYLATRPLNDGAVTMDLDDLLASVGSTLRGVPPAKVRQLFTDAPDMLVSMGLLRSLPVYSTRRTPDGLQHRVTLRPGTPPSDELQDALVQTLIAWNVIPAVASKMVQATPEWAATVVAATTLGMLVSKKSLPAMVVDYLKHPARELDPEQLPRFKPTKPSHQITPTFRPEMRYLQEQFDHSFLHLNGLMESDKDHLRGMYHAVNRPDWVVDGLMLAAARLHRRGSTLLQYINSQGGLLGP